MTVFSAVCLIFRDDLPKPRDVEKRLSSFLKTTREKAQRAEIEAGRLTDDDRVYPYDLVDDADKQRIKGRAIWFLERKQAATGMQHLSEENRVRLNALDVSGHRGYLARVGCICS